MKHLTPRLLLLPLAWLYDAVTRLRNWRYDHLTALSQAAPMPIIVVGNLAVGGTGKTPHTEYLLRLLAPGRRVAMLSRGYGRRSSGYVQAAPGLTADELGDEPWQVWQKFPSVTVAVDADRVRGLQRLQTECAPSVVVLDDAFQHRRVRGGLRVLLTDYARLYADDWLMPAGSLRESARGARRADVVVVTKCPERLTAAEQQRVASRLRLRSGQQLFFTRMDYGQPYPLFADEANGLPATPPALLALTGIARPQPLHAHLARTAPVRPLTFPDHHRYGAADAARINAAFAALPAGSVAVTTEKDAARLRPLRDALAPALRGALYVQPIEVAFAELEPTDSGSQPSPDVTPQDRFNAIIRNYVDRHSHRRGLA